MPELHVRNVPADLHERLRRQAAAEGRSMSAEVVVLLRGCLEPADDRAARQQAAIERLREIRSRSPLPSTEAPAERLVREDRDRVG